MKEYDILKAYALTDIIKKTNIALQEGWQLQGGVAVAVYYHETIFIQAIYREVK